MVNRETILACQEEVIDALTELKMMYYSLITDKVSDAIYVPERMSSISHFYQKTQEIAGAAQKLGVIAQDYMNAFEAVKEFCNDPDAHVKEEDSED